MAKHACRACHTVRYANLCHGTEGPKSLTMPQKRSPVIRSQPQKQLRERGSQRRKNGSFLAPAKPLSDNGGGAAGDRALLILGAIEPEGHRLSLTQLAKRPRLYKNHLMRAP